MWIFLSTVALYVEGSLLTDPNVGFLLQHTSVSPDGRLVIVVGDNTDGLLADTQSGKVI